MRNPLRPEPALGFFALLLPLPLLGLVLYWFGFQLLAFLKDPFHYPGTLVFIVAYGIGLTINALRMLARNRRAKGLY